MWGSGGGPAPAGWRRDGYLKGRLPVGGKGQSGLSHEHQEKVTFGAVPPEGLEVWGQQQCGAEWVRERR